MIDQLYREHGHVVLRRARRLLGSEAEARDAFHEIFLSLVTRPEQLRGVTRITSWLYAVTTHYCLNALRKRRTQMRILDGLAPPPPDAGRRGELMVRVRALLERLPAPLDEVAVYYYVDEMTHDEIAAVLGCSRRKVGYLLERLQHAAREVELAPSRPPDGVAPLDGMPAPHDGAPVDNAPVPLVARSLKEQPS